MKRDGIVSYDHQSSVIDRYFFHKYHSYIINKLGMRTLLKINTFRHLLEFLLA